MVRVLRAAFQGLKLVLKYWMGCLSGVRVEVVVWIEMIWFLCVDFFLSFIHACDVSNTPGHFKAAQDRK
jgi:hypothetical protein